MNTGDSYNFFNMPPPNFKGQQPRISKHAPTNPSNYQRIACYNSRNNIGSFNNQPQYTSHLSAFSPQVNTTSQSQYVNNSMSLPFIASPNYCTPPPYPPPTIYQGTYPNTLGGVYRPLTNFYYKKKLSLGSDPQQTKNTKKRKKPLSQNIPTRKDWSVEDAKKALEVEKEFNKRHKRSSLIIKFPDLELNREIVSKFHPAIDSVHFQQPSTPRYCFVTLKDNISEEDVMKSLNSVKFGDGYLTVEHKKDKDDEINIGPEDIDPFTLYVGNLVQEVTKEDIVRAYPKQRRIDIGFAKKMKYTRYAFVCFRTVADAIEAFQNTYATEMYSKSLIVRFRRLHGTHGMSGDPKQPSMPKRKEIEGVNNITQSETDAGAANVFKVTTVKQEPMYSYLDMNIQQDTENVFTIKEEHIGFGECSYSSASEDEDDPLPDCFRNYYISNTNELRNSTNRESNYSNRSVHLTKKEPEDNGLQKSKSLNEFSLREFEIKKELVIMEPHHNLPLLEVKTEKTLSEGLPPTKYHFPIKLPIKQEDIVDPKTSHVSTNKIRMYHVPMQLPVKSEKANRIEYAENPDGLSDDDINDFL